VRSASRRAIGVRRFAGALELSEPPAAGAASMELPEFLGLDGDRLEVEVETPTPGGWEGTVVDWLPGTTTRVPVADGPVRIRSPLGDGVTVAAPPPPPRSASASSTSNVAELLVEELRELGVPEPDDVALVIDADRAGPSPRRTLGDVVDARNRGTATVLLAAPPRGEPATAPDEEEPEGKEGPEIVRLVDELIATALLLAARELAIEPRGPELDADATVRFDDGEPWTFVRIAARAIPGVVARVKVLADMDIAERRVAQTRPVRWSVHPAARIVATTRPMPRATRRPTGPHEAVTLRIEDPGLGGDHHAVRLPAEGAGEEETARRLRTLAIEIERRRFAAWAKEVRTPGNERFPDFSAELARHPELLGRNALLDHLAGWVDADDLPAPRSMAIVGRVGVGKTALIAHAVGRWREAGHPVALHVVDRWGRETLDDVLRSLARQVERHAGLRPPRGLDARGRLSAALARALGREVEGRWTGEWNPLVVCVDGIDAIDGVDLGALDAALRVPEGDGLRLVWTVRAESEVASSYAPDRDRHVVDLDEPEWRGPADEAMRVWLERGGAGGATA
ncbi:MAG: AAA family ATPase, partial [Planctomycetota bacterium JB042]